jgi:WD40 repeat protein
VRVASAARAIESSLVATIIMIVTLCAPAAAREVARFIPHLSLTDLQPVKVLFAPDDSTLLLVVNSNGRIDLFDISNSGRPVKITEISAAAVDAAFTPKGTSRDNIKIVSNSFDGSVRLWTLDGRPIGKPFKGHAGIVASVAFAPDGAHVASGGADGTVRMWTLDGKSLGEPFKGHEGIVYSVAFSPNGQRIVSAGADGTVRLWTLDGRPVGEPFKGHEGWISNATFSPDGTRILSGGRDGTVRIWTLDGKPAGEPFKGHAGKIYGVVFSPGGAPIISGGADGTVRLWAPSGEQIADPLKGHNGEVWTVAFSSDGTRFASGGDDGFVRVWMLAAKATPFKAHDGRALSVAFSPDGTRIVSGGADGTFRLWTITGQVAAKPVSAHEGRVLSVAFSPDGKLVVTAGSDGTVRLWELDGRPVGEPFKADKSWVSSAAFSPDGTQIVSGGADGTLRVWTLDGKSLGEPFKGHEGSVYSVAFSPNGQRIVSAGADGTVRLWTLDGKQVVAPFKGHDRRVWSVAFSRNGNRIISGGEDGTVRLWTPDGKPAAEPFTGHDIVFSVAYSSGDALIVSSGPDGIRLWTPDGRPAAEPIKGHEGTVWSVAFTRQNLQFVSGGMDGTVRVWTLDGKAAAEPFKGRGDPPLRAAFSPTGSHIAASDARRTQLWPLDGTAAGPLTIHHEALSLAFSPDAALIVSGGIDGMLRLSTLDGKESATRFGEHEGGVSSVAFSADGSRIVSGGRDGTVRLWTLEGKAVAEPFKGHKQVRSVAFSPDGSRIVSGDDDGTIRLWTIDGKAAAEPFKAGNDGILSIAFSPDGDHILSGDFNGIRRWSIQARTYSSWDSCAPRSGIGFLRNGQFWIGCSDRLILHTPSFKRLGEVFPTSLGIIGLLYSEGVYLPNDRMESPFQAIGSGGAVNWGRHAVAEVSLHRLRQVLLDDRTWFDRIQELAKNVYSTLSDWYQLLGWLKGAFWPVLGWLVALTAAISMWVVAPNRLATWVMPRVGSPEIPTWKWLAGVLTLFGYLGTTRRALRAWLRENGDTLYEQNFAGRIPVKEREKYCDLTYEPEIAAFAAALTTDAGIQLWINGVGGSGKSALSFQLARRARENNASSALPILVDEDWDGLLLDHIAQLLRVNDRCPTRKMVEVLGSGGELYPIIDSLSERGMPNAAEKVGNTVITGAFKSIVVTSRQSVSTGKAWQRFRSIIVMPLTAAQVPDYIGAYAPLNLQAQVADRIRPLIGDRSSLSPLFLRFAIEQALAGAATSTSTLDLILQYVEALRAHKLDLNADDMLRAASIAARESLRNRVVPGEIEQAYLRGVLVKEADALPFMNSKNNSSIDPAAIIEMLISCGLLNRNRTNRRLQFAYDPVAEKLAAHAATQELRGLAPSKSAFVTPRIRNANEVSGAASLDCMNALRVASLTVTFQRPGC